MARLPLQLRALDGNWEPTLGVEPVTPATIAGVRSFMKSIEIYARGALDRFIAQTLARQRENPRALTSGVPRLTAPARPVGRLEGHGSGLTWERMAWSGLLPLVNW